MATDNTQKPKPVKPAPQSGGTTRPPKDKKR